MTLNPSTPEQLRAWQARSKPLRRGGPLRPLGVSGRWEGTRETGLAGVRDIASARRATVTPLPARKPQKRTGFPSAVKMAVRKRAGGGDPDEARCEATGVWLGRYGGEIQHRDARGMGGTSLPVTNSVVNAVLLSKEAHRRAEDRDPLLNAQGFWLRHGEDPAETPIMLQSQYGSGVTVWLTPQGGYSPTPPFGGAA